MTEQTDGSIRPNGFGLAEPLPPHAQALLAIAQASARDLFNQHGECPAHVIGMTVNCQMPPPVDVTGMTKHAVGGFIAEVKKTMAVALLNEAWMTHYETKPDSPIATALKSGSDDVVLMPPRTDPNRFEVVMIQLHVGDRQLVCSARIERKGQEKSTLADWFIMDNARQGAAMRRVNFEGGDQRLTSGIVK